MSFGHYLRGRAGTSPLQFSRAQEQSNAILSRTKGTAAVADLCIVGAEAWGRGKRAEARGFFATAARSARDWRVPYLALADIKRELGDPTSARELVDLAPADPMGEGDPIDRLWRKDRMAAIHTEAVYRAVIAEEWSTANDQAREALKLRPDLDGVLVRRFRALQHLNRMEEAKELLVELRRRVRLYLLWDDIVRFVQTRYASEPTDRIAVKTWQIPEVFDLRAMPDNRVCVAAGAKGIWFLKPDGGALLLPGTAENDGSALWPHLVWPGAGGEVWLVGRNSDEVAVALWRDRKVGDETPVPPIKSLPDFQQLLGHQGDVWAVCGGIVFRQHGNDWIAYVPARGKEKLTLPPGVWTSARRRWNVAWQSDANEELKFPSEAKADKYFLNRYWKRLAPDSGLSPHDPPEEKDLRLWHDSAGRLWYGTQPWDGKTFLQSDPRIRAAVKHAWWLSGPRWWNPSQAWRREWVYLATHFRGAEDTGPLLRGSDLDSTGRLWVGLWEGGVLTYDGHRWLAIPLKDVPVTVRDVVATKDGAVWIACEDRVVRVVASVAEQR
ncbi:MAG: hypothetical protein HY318_14760 [Armatimonadetes bacterium]|nr:hypothetical protein [Armatimonadota bacterium]